MKIKTKYKKIILYSLFALFIYVLYSSPMNNLKIFGVGADLLLPLVIIIAMFEGEKAGAILGLVIGLFSDTNGRIGYNAVFYMITGYIIGVLLIAYLRKNFVTGMMLSLVLVMINNLFAYVIFFLVLEEGTVPAVFLLKMIFLKGLLSSLFAGIIYLLYYIYTKWWFRSVFDAE